MRIRVLYSINIHCSKKVDTIKIKATSFNVALLHMYLLEMALIYKC